MLSLSHIHRLPEELEQLTKSDLAGMVKGLLKEMESEAGEDKRREEGSPWS